MNDLWRLSRLAPLVIVFFAACSHGPRPDDDLARLDGMATPAGLDVALLGADARPVRNDSLLTLVTVASPLDTLAADIPDIPDSTAEASRERVGDEAATYDIPIDLNRRVLTFIEKHTTPDGWFGRSLQRSGRYLPMILEIFEEEGVPKDLAYMALIESGYRHNARSRAGAIGLWQFIRGTAKRYGLLCNSLVDERLDPERSTRAAARYLRDLHEMFDDWYLAMAAYNAGEGRVSRAIRRTGSRDFWELAQTKYLVRETRNYVPAILAAIVISKSPERFGFGDVIPDAPIEYETCEVPSVTHVDVIATCCEVPGPVVRSLNPALIAGQTPPGHHPYEVRIPVGSTGSFLAALEKIPPNDRMLFARHRVRKGESLSVLARRYGTSVGAIQQANRMGRGTVIRVGQVLQVPTTDAHVDLAQAALAARGEKIRHRVRRGETVSAIAKAYGTTVAAIQVWNDLPDPHAIRSGQSLSIYAGVRSATPSNHMASVSGHRNGDENGGGSDGVAVHTVARGETLWSIARRSGMSVNSLRRLNPEIRSSNVIRPGDKLLVRMRDAGQQRVVHTVARGETLWEIADRYGITVGQLRTWNGLSRNNSLIRPGDSLTLYQ